MLELITAISIYCRIDADPADMQRCYEWYQQCATVLKPTIEFPTELFIRCGDVPPTFRVAKKECKTCQSTKRKVARNKPRRRKPKSRPLKFKSALPVEVLLDREYGRK